MPEKESYTFCSKSSERKMQNSLSFELRSMVRKAAEPVQPGETVKAQLRRAWNALGRPKQWRIRAAWYSEAGSWPAEVVDDWRKRTQEIEAKKARLDAHKSSLEITRLQAVAETLERIDHEFHRPEIERIRALLTRARDEAGG